MSGGDTQARRRRGQYTGLLAILLASMAFQLAAPDEGWARLVTITVQGAALLLALAVSEVRRWLIAAAAGVVSLAVLVAAVALLGFDGIGPLPARLTTLMLVGLAPAAIIVSLIRDYRSIGAITVRTMFGVLCVYLLLGMLFASFYGAIASIDPSGFFADPSQDTAASFLYFSYATMTTVGYGDLVAATGVGRSLAIVEALVGQIYLVTVVALIVGNLGRRRARAEPPA